MRHSRLISRRSQNPGFFPGSRFQTNLACSLIPTQNNAHSLSGNVDDLGEEAGGVGSMGRPERETNETYFEAEFLHTSL